MTVSIDVERRTIRAGVHDLLGEPEQRAIGLGGSGLTRLWIGSELHRKVQGELLDTEPGYSTEVPVSVTLDIDGWTVEINGRADGVVFDGQTALRVDEIKTLHFASELHNLYADQRLDRFRRQAMLYGLMLMGEAQAPAARLILVDIISHEERDEDVAWDPDAVHAWLRQQVHRMVSAEERRLARLEELAEVADQIPFPHEEMRPVQEEIGAAVADAVEHSRHLLLRAPTGCGKTAAVLHPAIRGALARGKRVFFLTAKTLQQMIACDTANRMQEGLFRSLQLRAKSKMCANTEIVCHEEFCPYAKEYGLKLVQSSLIQNLLDGSEHQDPDRVFSAAREHTVCPFEVSLDLLPFVDLIVCDYNYVFDPVIGLQALLENGALEDTVLVIDEAHNLIDRSRGYYSPQIPIDAVEKAAAFLEGRSNPVFDELGVLVNELADYVKRTVAQSLDDQGPDEGPAALDEQAISDLRIAFDGAMLGYFYYKREHKLWMANDPVADVFFKLSHFHRVLRLGGDEFVHIAERDKGGGGEKLTILCRDASRFVGEILDASAASIAMSATLEPFDFYRDLLGFDAHRTDELYLQSPFPAENRLVMAIGDVDTTYRRRGAHYDGIANWIARLAHPDGNMLVLFPSYAFLGAVHDRLPAVPHTVVAQRPNTTDAQQQKVLKALQSGKPHLLLAVLGGIYAEGVDYPGDMLSQVVVVSPGLPQFNLERELLKMYYQEFYDHGFSYAYLIPGMTRVVQAAGRLLRSETDRGTIILMGKRFLDGRYFRMLPEEWTFGDLEALTFDDPESAIRDFFS